MFGEVVSKGYIDSLSKDSHAYQFIVTGRSMLERTGAVDMVASIRRSATRHQDEVDTEEYVDFREGTVGVGMTWDPHTRSSDTIVYQALRVEALPFLGKLRVRGDETIVFDATNEISQKDLRNAINTAYRNPEQFEFDAGGYGGGV